MKLGIEAIGVSKGSACIDNLSRVEKFDRPADFIRNKIGFTALRRLGENQTIIDLCHEAVLDLCRKRPLHLEDVDCLVVVTQNPASGGLPHTAALLHGKLGLAVGCAAFDISLGCSGFVYALSIVTGFMQTAGLRLGLIVTADPYSVALDDADVNTELLFGDAATCTLISDAARYVQGLPVLATNGALNGALRRLPDTGKISMDGRGIFNFTMRFVPEQIATCLRLNKLATANVDFFLLHQASRFIVEQMGKKMGLPEERVPFGLADIGNCVSSTIPYLLSRMWDKKTDVLLLSGFGVGLSWATTVIYKK